MIFQPLINDDGDNLLKRYYEYVIAVDEKVSDMSQYEKDNDTTEDNGTTANKDTFSRVYKNGKSTLGLKYGSKDFNMAIAIPTKEVSAKRQYIYAWSKDSEEMVLKKRMNNGMYEMTYENMGLISKPNQSQINNFKSWYTYKINNGTMSAEERYDFNKIGLFKDMISKGYLVIQLNCK